MHITHIHSTMQFARGPAASRTQSQCARTQKSVHRLVQQKAEARRTLVQRTRMQKKIKKIKKIKKKFGLRGGGEMKYHDLADEGAFPSSSSAENSRFRLLSDCGICPTPALRNENEFVNSQQRIPFLSLSLSFSVSLSLSLSLSLSPSLCLSLSLSLSLSRSRSHPLARSLPPSSLSTSS